MAGEQFDYAYDSIGNRLTHEDDRDWEYTANELNQYDAVETDDGNTPVIAEGYRFDEDGNLEEAFVNGDMNCDGLVNTLDTLSGVKGRPATPTRL